MSKFDGTDAALSYGQALSELARAVNWPTEQHRAEVVKAIETEHGIYVVPQEEVRANEIARLRALKAEQDKAAKEEAEAAELAELRRSLGLDPETGAPVDPAKLDLMGEPSD